MSQTPFAALILAGRRRAGDPVAAAGGRTCKAFVEVGGRPMIEHVVDALERSGRVNHIAISLSDDADILSEAPGLAARIERGDIARIAAADSPSGSVADALALMPAGTPLLVTTADHPLLTPRIVSDFLAAAGRTGADLAIGLTRIAPARQAYPRVRRTKLKMRDGQYSGCNLFAFMGPDAGKVATFWRRAEEHRKKPWRLAWSIGPADLLAYALGRLSLEGAMARVGRLLGGVRIRPVILAHPHANTDVDSVEDLTLVRQIFDQRAGVRTAPQAAARTISRKDVPEAGERTAAKKAAAG